MRRDWWLPIAATVAVANGIGGALAASMGRFSAAAALLASSVLLLRWPRSIWRTPGRAPLSPRVRWIALAAVFAVAVFFRAYRFEPPGLWGDDALNGLIAFDILDGKVRSPFDIVVHSNSHFHALSNYPIAAAFWAFGAGPATLRLPGVLANLASLVLLYGTAAPLFGARAGLVAAALFASSPMQITHAKSLIQIVLGQLFQLAGLCLLVRGTRGRGRWQIAASGVPFALCLYTYHAAKIAPLVAVPYFVAATLRRTGPRRPAWRAGLWALAVFAVCSIPAIVSYAAAPQTLTGRIAGTALWPAVREQGWGALWDSVWRTLLVFHYQQGPILYHWFGIGFDPALNCVVAFLLVHGLVQALWRWREPRNVLLLGWLAVGLIPGFLSTDAPRVYRVFLAAAPLYVLAALPVAQLLRLRPSPAAARRWLHAVAVSLLVAVPLIDFNYYFYRLYTHPLFRHFQAESMVEMASELRRCGKGWVGYLLSEHFDARHESFRFLSRAWGLDLRDVASLADVLPVRDAPAGALFLMTRDTMDAADAIAAWYPEHELVVRRQPEPLDWWLGDRPPLGRHRSVPQPSTVLLHVPSPAESAPRGVAVTFFSARGAPLARRTEPTMRLGATQSLSAAGFVPPWVRLAAVLTAERDGTYGFAARSATPLRLVVDGEEVVAAGSASGAVELKEGPHRLIAEAALREDADLRVLWQPPGENLRPIPARALYSVGHGLTVEFRTTDAVFRRFEPYPFYAFFTRTLPGTGQATWRGRIEVPAGGRTLRVETNGRAALKLDGRAAVGQPFVGAGTHDFELRIADLPASVRLRIRWRLPAGAWEAVPPQAFVPPGTAGPPRLAARPPGP